MKLYITPNSPYARLARIVAMEKDIISRIEVIEAQTRVANSPYYKINPSGRVPYLIDDSGRAYEDSALICRILDEVDGRPCFHPPGLAHARLEALARSLADGIAVYGRELRRPENERSPTILAHEEARYERMLDAWEREIGDPLMHGPLNMAQLALIAGIDFAERFGMGPRWRTRPQLAAWVERMRAIPVLKATSPLEAS